MDRGAAVIAVLEPPIIWKPYSYFNSRSWLKYDSANSVLLHTLRRYGLGNCWVDCVLRDGVPEVCKHSVELLDCLMRKDLGSVFSEVEAAGVLIPCKIWTVPGINVFGYYVELDNVLIARHPEIQDAN